MIFLGVGSSKLNLNPKGSSHVYEESTFTAEIFEIKSYPKFDQLLVSILDHDKEELKNEKVLISSSCFNFLSVGDLVFIRSDLNVLDEASIPDQFSFKKYNSDKGIYYQTFLYDPEIVKKVGKVKGLNYFLQKIRNFIGQNISKTFTPEVEGVIRSLVLGDKTHLLKSQKNDYTTSGVIHVLAVSGLHVGLFYLFLVNLLIPFVRKRGVYIFLLVLGLLIYAGLTGFSPSVIRASVMFMFFGVAKVLQKRSTSLNVLFMTSFFILIYDPNYLFDIGFQLSFSAVFGIITCFGYVNNLVSSKYWLVRKIWSALSVSLVAQIFTAPLVTYYFHQLPVYFLLTNLIVVFLIPLVLISGMFAGVFGEVWHVWVIGEKLVMLINAITHWVSNLPFSKIEGLWVTGYQVAFLYVLIASFFLFWILKKRFFALIGFLSLLLVLYISFGRFNIKSQQDYLCFHKMRKSFIVEQTSGKSSFLNVFGSIQKEYNLRRSFFNYWARQNVSDVSIIQGDDVRMINGSSYGTVKAKDELFFDFNVLHYGQNFYVYNRLGEVVFSSNSESSLIIAE